MLCNIEPEIQIIDRSLLVAHVDVEEEQVDWGKGPPAQDFKQCWEPVPVEVWNR